jgi:transcriptional regulator
MYIPERFRTTERKQILEVMRLHPFAVLVTIREGEPFATHVPLLIHEGEGGEVLLRGHLARLNPQGMALAQEAEVLVIFQGADSYISPAWYTHHPSVPTWNYMAVHAYGKARIIEGEPLRQLMLEAIEVFEAGVVEDWKPEFTEEYWERMLNGVVGFEIRVTRLEGKFKLSQNRSAEEREIVGAALRHQVERTRGAEMADWMERLETD